MNGLSDQNEVVEGQVGRPDALGIGTGGVKDAGEVHLTGLVVDSDGLIRAGGRLRISVIMDGVSEPSWTRRGCA